MKSLSYLLPTVALLLSAQTVMGQTEQPPTKTAKIYAVIDGDTVKAVISNKKVTIRLIGMDAPEANPPQCFSREAAQAMRGLVLNKTVKLEADKVVKDKYGRWLRYAYLEDGRMVNEELIKGGFASTLVIDNARYKDRLAAAQDTAKTTSVGIWGACHGPVVATAAQLQTSQQASVPAAPVAPVAPVAQAGPGGNCDPSYPEVCITPAPPDLDCKDVQFRRFKVLAPDPHRFDGNHDGVGCEK